MDEQEKRKEIIAQLVEARLEKGITQAELARLIGTQRSNICRLESGAQNLTLDMLLKITAALGKDITLSLEDKEEIMSSIYSLRIYDMELMRFSMEKRGLEGLVADILSVNKELEHLMPLDMERTNEGVIKWLERRVIPKNRTFVDEILKTLIDLGNVTEIIVESRPEYVKEDVLDEIFDIIGDTLFEVSIGLETSNDYTRLKKINKGFTRDDFENAVKFENIFSRNSMNSASDISPEAIANSACLVAPFPEILLTCTL